jgi:uncharacterized protein YndB with AHSA1/START domain
MTSTLDTGVRRSVTVNVPVDHAFRVFTERFDTWWPASHHIAPNPFAAAIIEPHEGGRWYERDAEGNECEWGRVLAWEPPARVVLSWTLSPEFRVDPDPAHASEVEVRFTPEGPGTVVVLEHRHIDRHGDGWPGLRESVGSQGGWPGLLERFAAAAEGRTPPDLGPGE